MDLCQVTGTVVSTVKHRDYDGQKLMIVQPIDSAGQARGAEYLALDHVQAGVGDRVLVLREGNGIRQIFGVTRLAVQCLIVGIVDEVDDVARG